MRYPAKSSGSLPDSRRVLASGPRFAAFSQFLGPGQCAATDRMQQSAWATTIDETGEPSRVEVDRIENAGVESRDSCRGARSRHGSLSGPRRAGGGGDTVQRLYDALLSTMKNGRTLGQSGRFTQLEPVIRGTFDIPSMSQLSVGPSWATLTEAQRQQVMESFGRYISAIYADRFDSYAGQKLQVTGEPPAAGGVIVRSQIVKANGEPVNVDYMMRRKGDSWLISDIYLDGAISEVA